MEARNPPSKGEGEGRKGRRPMVFGGIMSDGFSYYHYYPIRSLGAGG